MAARTEGLVSRDAVSRGGDGTVEGGWLGWLRGFGELQGEQLRTVMGQVRERMQGDYEVDLAPVKQTARLLAAILREAPETQPYAAWLQARCRDWPNQVEFRIGSAEVVWIEASIPGVELEGVLPGLLEARGAEHFVPRLKPIFESMRLPVELVWVAEVESAFNPRAVSPVGAAGLYQLMPATARQYGLVLEPEDDRFHPEKNARAAARHMLYLSQVFDDWPLAMAAYNAGHNRVRGLLAKHNARSFEEIAVYLPRETQLFVPKVDATLVRREGVSLARLSSPVP
jgi:membrane-bound lytic murein transglycosylase D